MRFVRIVFGMALTVSILSGVSFGQEVVGFEYIASIDENENTSDWLHWRGPNRNGIAVNQSPLTNWNETNVLWKTEIPGRGHSSPTIIGDKIFLTTCESSRKTQSVLCFDRNSGERLWQTDVHEEGLTQQVHPNNSRASHTLASDGNHLYCVFVNNAKVMLSKLNLDGEQVWQKELGVYESDFGFGAGASPIIWNDKLFVTSECSKDSFVMALDLDGEELWRTDRSPKNSFSTPVIANVAGRDQLLQPGINSIKSYDPANGEELWSVETQWSVSCATMIWNEKMVFASGGFPGRQTLGIDAETGKVVWEAPVKCYEQSMLIHDGHIYGLSDAGVCHCWDAATGTEKWKQRMKSKVSASPVFAGGHIYFTTEDGTCFVLKPNPDACEIVAQNNFGDSAFSTPTFVDNKIYARAGTRDDQGLQEFLYCIGAAQ